MSISETMAVRARLEALERQVANLCALINALQSKDDEKRKPGRPPKEK